MTREERCSFPVGTDRPARRRPAALDRPVTPVPFCRAGWPNVNSVPAPKHNSYVSGGHVPYISDIVSRVPSLLSRWTLGLCTVHLAPHRVCPHAALHHPPVHPGYHPPSRRWRGGCSGAPRRCMRFARMPALVPRPHGPSRWCTVFCTAQPGVYRFGPLQTSLLPCGFCRITGPGSRSEPPSDQSGCQSLS